MSGIFAKLKLGTLKPHMSGIFTKLKLENIANFAQNLASFAVMKIHANMKFEI